MLLDRAPADATPPSGIAGEQHLRVQRLLTHMAAAEPHRYVVVDADGTPDEVAQRIHTGLAGMLPTRPHSAPAPLREVSEERAAP